MFDPVELILVLAVLGLTIMLLLSLVLIRRLRRIRTTLNNPAAQVRPPMDRTRRVFHRTLRQALPRHVILAQVGYGRFLKPDGLSARRSEKIAAELEHMVADYLICSDGLDLVAVAALDDSADREQEELLESAALPLLRWRSDNPPSIQEIRETVQDLESLSTLNRPEEEEKNKMEQEEVTITPVSIDDERREPSLGDAIDMDGDGGRQEPKL